MGSNDIPPPHVPSNYLLITDTLLQIGGTLWTLCYVLLTRSSFRTKSYGMPLFALCFNFAWEIVYAFVITEALLERIVFSLWSLLDIFMIYGVIQHGSREWSHSPIIGRNLGKVIVGMTFWCLGLHWSSAKWWIDNEVGGRKGKFYNGRDGGPDMTELAFWSVAISQIYLSVASLGQLVVRQHTGGVSWGVWASRTAGSIIGFDINYFWMWLYWREAHAYFMSPFGIFLWGTGLLCDLIYPFVFYRIRKAERVLPDGSKAPGLVDSQLEESKRK